LAQGYNILEKQKLTKEKLIEAKKEILKSNTKDELEKWFLKCDTVGLLENCAVQYPLLNEHRNKGAEKENCKACTRSCKTCVACRKGCWVCARGCQPSRTPCYVGWLVWWLLTVFVPKLLEMLWVLVALPCRHKTYVDTFKNTIFASLAKCGICTTWKNGQEHWEQTSEWWDVIGQLKYDTEQLDEEHGNLSGWGKVGKVAVQVGAPGDISTCRAQILCRQMICIIFGDMIGAV